MKRWFWKRWVWAVLVGTTAAVGLTVAQPRGTDAPPAIPKVGDTISLKFRDGPDRQVKVLKSEKQPDGSYLSEVRDMKTGETFTLADRPGDAPAGAAGGAAKTAPRATDAPKAKERVGAAPVLPPNRDPLPDSLKDKKGGSLIPAIGRPTAANTPTTPAPTPPEEKPGLLKRLFGRTKNTTPAAAVPAAAAPAAVPSLKPTNPEFGTAMHPSTRPAPGATTVPLSPRVTNEPPRPLAPPNSVAPAPVKLPTAPPAPPAVKPTPVTPPAPSAQKPVPPAPIAPPPPAVKPVAPPAPPSLKPSVPEAPEVPVAPPAPPALKPVPSTPVPPVPPAVPDVPSTPTVPPATVPVVPPVSSAPVVPPVSSSPVVPPATVPAPALPSVPVVPPSTPAPADLPPIPTPPGGLSAAPAVSVQPAALAVTVVPGDHSTSHGRAMMQDIQPHVAALQAGVAPTQRALAARALSGGRHASTDAVKGVLFQAARNDPAALVRCVCIEELCKLGYYDPAFLAFLHTACDDSSAEVKAAAKDALAKMLPRK